MQAARSVKTKTAMNTTASFRLNRIIFFHLKPTYKDSFFAGNYVKKGTQGGSLRILCGLFAEVLIVRAAYDVMVDNLFFRGKNELKVDLGDLQAEREKLSGFLRVHFKVDSSASNTGLKLDASAVSPNELEQMVNKFVSRQNHSSTHRVILDKNSVKIKRFERTKKTKENKHPTTPATITHGW